MDNNETYDSIYEYGANTTYNNSNKNGKNNDNNKYEINNPPAPDVVRYPPVNIEPNTTITDNAKDKDLEEATWIGIKYPTTEDTYILEVIEDGITSRTAEATS